MSINAVAVLNRYRKKLEDPERTLLETLERIAEMASDIIDVARESRDLHQIVGVIEHFSQTVMPRIRKELADISKDALKNLGSQLQEVVHNLAKSYYVLGKLAYIIYLASQNKDVLNAGLIFYATSKALEEPGDSKELLYILAGVQLLPEKTDEALALVAYGIKDKLPVKSIPETGPWVEPRKWAAILYLSFMYDIASGTNAELLAEWGFLEALYEEER